jgi:hypothetical protein
MRAANPAAFEPTQTSNGLTLRKTALGLIASPICLDFIHDPAWAAMPAQVFLVPAMSEGLSRFQDHSRKLGGKGAASFVCNAGHAHLKNGYVVYQPSKQATKVNRENELLFTIDVDIEMNKN